MTIAEATSGTATVTQEGDTDELVCVRCEAPIAPNAEVICYGDPFCIACTAPCGRCGTWLPTTEIEGALCPGCAENYVTCYECCDLSPTDECTEVGGEWVCRSCLDDDYTFCDNCQRYERYDDRCSASLSDDGPIQDYSYKPAPDFHCAPGEAHDPSRPYFGVELETEACQADAEAGAQFVLDALGDLVYVKSDGSLDDGFEIVTHPMSLAFAQGQSWDVLRELGAMGFRSWQTKTCGIHVHVSRSGFKGSAHLWRFCHLIYRNPAECARFAGRASSQWARFDGQRAEVAKVLKREQRPERYVAVNLCNAATVEVRMFRGSLNGKRLVADVEFVAAAVEHTRHLAVPDVEAGALDWSAFCSYVGDHDDAYPHLFELLAEGGW